MTNDPVQRLAEHAAARDAWLAATSGQLRGDERVAAVWLVGSLGQESGDTWSDLDLVVVARDEDLPALVERPRSEFGRFGEVLVAIDAPQRPGRWCLPRGCLRRWRAAVVGRLVPLAALDRQASQRRSGAHRAS